MQHSSAWIVIGGISAYRVGRDVQVRLRGSCAYVPRWTMSWRSSGGRAPDLYSGGRGFDSTPSAPRRRGKAWK